MFSGVRLMTINIGSLFQQSAGHRFTEYFEEYWAILWQMRLSSWANEVAPVESYSPMVLRSIRKGAGYHQTKGTNKFGR
jgi:hypothetical protein